MPRVLSCDEEHYGGYQRNMDDSVEHINLTLHVRLSRLMPLILPRSQALRIHYDESNTVSGI